MWDFVKLLLGATGAGYTAKHGPYPARTTKIRQTYTIQPTTLPAQLESNFEMSDIGIASQEDMKKARLPLGYRDSCANFLITLNKCRHKGNFMPWKCGDERHAYEHCQYKDYTKRMKQMQQQVQAAKDEAS
ncbi:hypothetical protein PTTG_27243 [Puccinia triticina 1-1 BBBD Race 1]|uniref:NADH dehydrogenase [ubiquinone] 1 beta subcomplex subunit 7 n=1 Tax=Puccinia triticina (isolate 1-1 / race 1 (BBBD)) TaxID=630390 RepID=A0A180GMY2_PUCT1|nr:hypothetical protein PTTG_27243 [Puccinia triticina 1-1 BBBD Race 1]WAR56441.1 hypothetical protein PtB15_7B290 [Puccinia triticina]